MMLTTSGSCCLPIQTLAFLLPIITLAFQRAEQLYEDTTQQHGSPRPSPIQALIIAPSQELAMQIMRVAQNLLPEPARPAVQQCIGGANPKRQQEALAKHKPLIVVGTPGRLAEMVRRGVLQLHQTPILVLDEADQLLGDNFKEDMAHVVEHAGKRVEGGRQTVLASATLSQTVLGRFRRWCPEPRFVTSGTAPSTQTADGGASTSGRSSGGGGGVPAWGWGGKGWEGKSGSEMEPKVQGTMGGAEADDLVPTMPPGLRHMFIVCDQRHRVDTLRKCVHAFGVERGLVFMNWQQRLKDTQHKLEARHMEVRLVEGGLVVGWGLRVKWQG